jgi:hypothetical protein
MTGRHQQREAVRFMSGYVDGNMLAGPLQDVFTAEMTTALTSCRHCGRTGPLAQVRVYGPQPGLVARCPGCEGVLLRLVRHEDEVWLDFDGLGPLHLDAGSSA